MQKNFGPTSVSRIARWNQKFLLAFLYAESTGGTGRGKIIIYITKGCYFMLIAFEFA